VGTDGSTPRDAAVDARVTRADGGAAVAVGSTDDGRMASAEAWAAVAAGADDSEAEGEDMQRELSPQEVDRTGADVATA
jgi:hypothetical protein